ncbi:MAG: riboflavin synthase [Candidatus Adiutrix sp.]|nr:riboflavin synthase [Candidatus Adiutrix sp.]
MFTGLTLGQGEISRRLPKGPEFDLGLSADFDWRPSLEPGESIAVSGVCLTVTSISGPRGFTAFASAETLKHTTLGRARRVNLERALALGDRLGGHLVSGHVDGPGTVRSIEKAAASLRYRFGAGRELMPLIVPKGSIAIDGVSLTVNEVDENSFTVNLIPHTARITTLGLLAPGDAVNLETDLIGKYVQRLMNFQGQERPAEGLTLELLARNGF